MKLWYPFLIAPFVGILATYTNYWCLAVCGGVLSSLGYFIGFFSTSLPVLYLGLGAICGKCVNIFQSNSSCFGFKEIRKTSDLVLGLGFGLSTFSTVIVIGHTFAKRRPLALGLCTAGVGAGMIVFPPLYTILLDIYGLRGLFLITAGLFLNNAVLGIFLRNRFVDQGKLQSVCETEVFPAKCINHLHTKRVMCTSFSRGR